MGVVVTPAAVGGALFVVNMGGDGVVGMFTILPPRDCFNPLLHVHVDRSMLPSTTVRYWGFVGSADVQTAPPQSVYVAS